jgi:hypothetical protein
VHTSVRGRLRASGALLIGLGAMAGCRSSGAAASPGMSSATAGPASVAPALDAITEADLRRDMFAMAGDAMRGREAGTLDEIRATGWVAERAREAGLQPAGDDGTFFQWWPLRRTTLSSASRVSLGGRELELWRDAVVIAAGGSTVDLPLVFLSDMAMLASTDVRGKAVAMIVAANDTQPASRFTIRGNPQSTTVAMLRQRAAQIARAGGSAALFVSDESAGTDRTFNASATVLSRGSYGIDSAGGPAGSFARPATQSAQGTGRGRGNTQAIPALWIRHALLDAARSSGARLTAALSSETHYYASGNVIGVVKGTDPKLANEYVLYSGHQDHDGVRYPVDGDSIWNGADDNASVSVAMLAIARAFVKHPAPRPVLFVWHGAEERGLLGSRWFVNHPVVPRSEIVAVLNGDMIGRNAPDSAALLGAQPPHRNSIALVNAALRANGELTHFKLDTIWDRPTHREGWYFRSDHLPYARAGIPAIMFSTLLHPDYHTPRDEPSRIEIPKLANMARWMYATGWIVATAAQRPDMVPGFKLER